MTKPLKCAILYPTKKIGNQIVPEATRGKNLQTRRNEMKSLITVLSLICSLVLFAACGGDESAIGTGGAIGEVVVVDDSGLPPCKLVPLVIGGWVNNDPSIELLSVSGGLNSTDPETFMSVVGYNGEYHFKSDSHGIFAFSLPLGDMDRELWPGDVIVLQARHPNVCATTQVAIELIDEKDVFSHTK